MLLVVSQLEQEIEKDIEDKKGTKNNKIIKVKYVEWIKILLGASLVFKKNGKSFTLVRNLVKLYSFTRYKVAILKSRTLDEKKTQQKTKNLVYIWTNYGKNNLMR